MQTTTDVTAEECEISQPKDRRTDDETSAFDFPGDIAAFKERQSRLKRNIEGGSKFLPTRRRATNGEGESGVVLKTLELHDVTVIVRHLSEARRLLDKKATFRTG